MILFFSNHRSQDLSCLQVLCLKYILFNFVPSLLICRFLNWGFLHSCTLLLWRRGAAGGPLRRTAALWAHVTAERDACDTSLHAGRELRDTHQLPARTAPEWRGHGTASRQLPAQVRVRGHVAGRRALAESPRRAATTALQSGLPQAQVRWGVRCASQSKV